MGTSSLDPTASISVKDAIQRFALTKRQVADLDRNKDGKITVAEFENSGLKSNLALKTYFTNLTSKTVNPKSQSNFSSEKNVTNPYERSLKSNFTRNYNNGQLSPVIGSDLAQSDVGNALPCLYA